MAGLSEITRQAQQFWASRDKRQKTFLLAGAAATAVLVGLFVSLLGAPDYKPLYTGLDPSDVQTLSAQLDAQSIPHQISADGRTISVPADKLDVARMQTAAQGTPHSGRMGFELFDKMSWGETEFDEKVTYQRALEGELERTIETLSDVKSARVHLVMATDSIYEDQQRAAKASVILKLNGDDISKDAVQAIARLVAGAVDGLKPADVNIIDADSDRSLNVRQDGMEGGEGLETSLAQQLMHTLEPVVGVGNIRASVNVAYDRSSSEESQEKYDPTTSALLSDQKSQDQESGDGSLGGVPGTASNVPAPKPTKTVKPVTSPGSSHLASTENARYGVNRVVIRRLMPAGQLQRISAAILVDDAVVKSIHAGKVTFTRRPRTPAELNKIQQLAQAVIGFDPQRGDTISIQNMPFATDADLNSMPTAGVAEKVQKAVTEYAAVLRPLSLLALFLLAYLFVLRPIQKQALGPGAEQAVLPEPVGAETPVLSSATVMNASQRAGQLKQETVEMIQQKPVNTARAVQAWLREETL